MEETSWTLFLWGLKPDRFKFGITSHLHWPSQREGPMEFYVVIGLQRQSGVFHVFNHLIAGNTTL